LLLYLLRSYYYLYRRRRLVYESALEAESSRRLLTARESGSDRAAQAALEALAQATMEPIESKLRARVADLCDDLFRSIGLQTSVAKYKASGPERGAVLDFLDYPLNNRWWLEDEIAKARSLPNEDARVRRLEELARWEDPAPGSFYDDIGVRHEVA